MFNFINIFFFSCYLPTRKYYIKKLSRTFVIFKTKKSHRYTDKRQNATCFRFWDIRNPNVMSLASTFDLYNRPNVLCVRACVRACTCVCCACVCASVCVYVWVVFKSRVFECVNVLRISVIVYDLLYIYLYSSHLRLFDYNCVMWIF